MRDGREVKSDKSLCANAMHMSREGGQSRSVVEWFKSTDELSCYSVIANLEKPRDDDDGSSHAFLVVPDRHCRFFAFGWRECGCVPELHHGLLGTRIGLTTSIMRCPQPPDQCEEDGPRGREYVVREKEVGKVEGLFWVLLNWMIRNGCSTEWMKRIRA